MGARQRGQHRQKEHSRPGSSKNTPNSSQKKSNSSLHVQSLDSNFRAQALQGWQRYAQLSSSGGLNGFSLSQEARNTETHGQNWSYSTPLRGKGISFVSAGNLRMEDEPASEHQTGDEQVTTEASSGQQIGPAPEHETDSRDVDAEPLAAPITTESEVTESKAQLFRERVSSMSTESSSEEIVFAGRQRPIPAGLTPPPTQRPIDKLRSSSSDLKSRLSIPGLPADNLPPDQAKRSSGQGSPYLKPETSPMESTSALSDSPAPPQRRMNSRPRGRRRIGRSKQELDEEEAIMQDYIDNLAMDDEEDDRGESNEQSSSKNEHHRFYDGAGDENAKVQILQLHAKGQTKLEEGQDWSSGDLEDFDGLSTTDEEISEIEQVLRKRIRPSGLQYLVSAVGTSTNEAKWILSDRVRSSMTREKIITFEDILQIRLQSTGDEEDASSGSEDDEALDDLIDDIASEDDENARTMRRVAKMTDEEIALALAKQEELGMGGDEVLLFSGVADEDEDDDEVAAGHDFIPFSISQHTSNRTRSKRNQRAADRFPSASAFADALDEDPYGAFDVMDFDRPSLKPKRKGRKGDFPYDLGAVDEELAESIRDTWTKDREKKAARKRERAEARSMAMFESATGDNADAIRNAIRMFLVQENDSLSLPVMAAHTRASVHRLAKALHLNSKSEGKGENRHPILTKTPRTIMYTVDTIWEVDALINQRRFFPKNATSYKSPKMPRTPASGARGRRGGGGAYSGASYMDGDVVGASAPEIGSENKGRAMLEKMGWSSGMAIGAVGNKGSTDVIKHVVKNTKAGLG